MSNRDDFSESVKQVLKDRVGGFCSNPDCRISTVGPNSDYNKRTSIGIAAHITAAAEGGPRYNPELSKKQRTSVENGIWLCASCANLIDKDPINYTVELLKYWKSQAELEQKIRLQNPHKLEARDYSRNDDTYSISIWRELSQRMEEYQGVINYAYEDLGINFKRKYPGIVNCKNDNHRNWMFNSDYLLLQDEIDQYWESLYEKTLSVLYIEFKKTQGALVSSFGSIRMEMSEELEDLFRKYMDCMDFHYETDGDVGLVNYYWSSFFVTLNNNYIIMQNLKRQIDSHIRKIVAEIKEI